MLPSSELDPSGAGFWQKCVGGLNVPGPKLKTMPSAAALGRTDDTSSELPFAEVFQVLEGRFMAEVLQLHRHCILQALGRNPDALAQAFSTRTELSVLPPSPPPNPIVNGLLARPGGVTCAVKAPPDQQGSANVLVDGISDRQVSKLYCNIGAQSFIVGEKSPYEQEDASYAKVGFLANSPVDSPSRAGDLHSTEESEDKDDMVAASHFPLLDAHGNSNCNVGPLPFAAKKETHEPIMTRKNKNPSVGHLLSMNKRATLSHKASVDHIGVLVNKLHGREHAQTKLQECVYSDAYTYMVTAAVVCQAALLGIQVELETQYEVKRVTNSSPEEIPLALDIANYVLLSFFLVEVILRIVVLRLKFFFPNDTDMRVWNYFDLIIVICSLPDFVAIDSSRLPLLHAVRLLRVIRVLRVARGIPPLRKMVFALIHCMLSLLWLVALMFVLLYMFALAFMQGAASDLKEYEAVTDAVSNATRLLSSRNRGSDCLEIIGPHPYTPLEDILTAMQNLFLMVTGDAEWERVLKPVMESATFYKCLGLFFSVFFFFGFMNVATGLFVEKAMQIASQDREMVLREALQREEEDLAIMRELFDAADLDGDGHLTVDEMRELVSNDDVRMWLAIIDLDIAEDFDAVLDILDPHNKGYVEAEEFYATIGRFRGSARKLETSLILLEARASQRSLHRHHTVHHSHMNNLVSAIGNTIDQKNEKVLRSLQASQRNPLPNGEVEQHRGIQYEDLERRLETLEKDHSKMKALSASEDPATNSKVGRRLDFNSRDGQLADQLVNIGKFIRADGDVERRHQKKLTITSTRVRSHPPPESARDPNAHTPKDYT